MLNIKLLSLGTGYKQKTICYRLSICEMEKEITGFEA